MNWPANHAIFSVSCHKNHCKLETWTNPDVPIYSETNPSRNPWPCGVYGLVNLSHMRVVSLCRNIRTHACKNIHNVCECITSIHFIMHTHVRIGVLELLKLWCLVKNLVSWFSLWTLQITQVSHPVRNVSHSFVKWFVKSSMGRRYWFIHEGTCHVALEEVILNIFIFHAMSEWQPVGIPHYTGEY